MSTAVLRQARSRLTVFWRTPIAAFFTLAFPLIFLGLVGQLVGNEVIESRSGVRVAQFLTPAIGAYAAATAAYTNLAIGLATDREQGVLRRQRMLPISTTTLLGGRVLAAAVTGLLAVAMMTIAGVVALDVQVVWAKLPAALVTILIGIACFAALGFAIASLARTAAATQAVTSATLIPLAFISDVFVITDDLPAPLRVIGGIFPLRAFANALGETFNPFTPGSGFAWPHLALMGAWAAVGVVVAARRFTWDPPSHERAGRQTAAAPARTGTARAGDRPVGEGSVEVGDTRPGSLVAGQVVAGVRAIVRTPSAAFFSLAFPVVMLLLFTSVFGNEPLQDRGGVVLAQHLAPALGIFGMATVTYAEFAERLASQRDRGILKRVRGTPLTLWLFVGGRIGSAVTVGVVTTVLVIIVGVLTSGVEVPLDRIGLGLLVGVAGLACFTMLGLALVALAPNAAAVPAIANGTLLPLGFVSDVFLIGSLPPTLQLLGDILPLRPAVTALSDVLNPALAPAVPWARLAVIAIWTLLAAVVVQQRFSWEPRRG